MMARNTSLARSTTPGSNAPASTTMPGPSSSARALPPAGLGGGPPGQLRPVDQDVGSNRLGRGVISQVGGLLDHGAEVFQPAIARREPAPGLRRGHAHGLESRPLIQADNVEKPSIPHQDADHGPPVPGS